MTGDDVRTLLARIEETLELLEAEAEQYGGWPGYDQDAVVTVDMGLRLAGLAHAVGLFDRETAEGGKGAPTIRREVAPSHGKRPTP